MNAAPTPGPVERRFGRLDCVVRPLRAGDEPKLQEFFASHTPDTIYERYGYLISTMAPERASALVNIDPSRDCALGIFERRPASEVLRAVGRYCLDADGRGAELAFVVHERTRRLGMASELLRLLVAAARRRGLGRVWARVHADNDAMIGVFQRQAFAFRTGEFARFVEASLRLVGGPGAGPAGARGNSSQSSEPSESGTTKYSR